MGAVCRDLAARGRTQLLGAQEQHSRVTDRDCRGYGRGPNRGGAAAKVSHPDRSNFTKGAVVQHALARVQMGLSARQFISEFRALRATVIRLWQRSIVEIDSASLEEMIRFNEAIDQVLGEGAITYTEEVDRSRELFLSVLGHDLRNPITAISGL